MRPASLRSAVLAAIAVLGTGCGSSTGFMGVSSPMTTEDEARFDNGVEVVGDLEGLAGHWRDSWNEEMDERIGRADLIAVIAIQTLHHDTDLERRSSYRIVAHVEERLRGEGHGELHLSSREDDPGFPSLRDTEARMVGQRFVAFIKWAQPEGEDGPILARWHLAPDTESVRSWISGRIAEQAARAEQ